MTELQYHALDASVDFNVKEFEQYFLQNEFNSSASDLSPVSFSPSLDSPQGSPSRDQNSPHEFIHLPALTSLPIPPLQPTLYNIEHNYIFEQEHAQSHIISIKDEDLNKSANSRKRKTATSRVQIPREELLKMTNKRETHSSLSTPENRPLTPEEDRMLKRQKRLIKNRESAQLSRLRKKIYIEELERKVYAISAENKALQDEVMYLRNMVKQLGATPPNMIPHQQQPSSSVNLFSPALTNKLHQKSVGTAGVCLLIILFSFGLFFNNVNDPTVDRPTFRRHEIPEVMPSKMRIGRSLKSLSESNDSDMDEDEGEVSKQIVQKNMSKSRKAITEEINEVEKALSSNWRTRVKQEVKSEPQEEEEDSIVYQSLLNN